MNICFVILHYLTDKDTIECVESIESLDGADKAKIVIVDNFSNNGSIEKVSTAIDKFSNCKILYSDKNLGFAKGNNIGYSYVKKTFGNSFIVVLNNDTVIKQNDFITRIVDTYNKNSYAVLGPDIISLIDGGHQNPLGKIPSKKAVKKDINKYRFLLLLSRLGVYNQIQKHFGANRAAKKVRLEKPQSKEIIDSALHGSCLIFSPDFISVMDEAFCPDTFLYKEEFILSKRCEKKNLKMFFNSEIEIFHKEDSSTNQVVNTEKKKREFVFRNLINSNKAFIKNY
ncbi:MAG: glycosyltransferase family 2 protein [Ruminococcus sp.]|nr:glycosyltransferase family 2 protein [Ruminococcus sp.]